MEGLSQFGLEHQAEASVLPQAGAIDEGQRSLLRYLSTAFQAISHTRFWGLQDEKCWPSH